MGKFTAYALQHRAILLFLTAVFVVAGVRAYVTLPVDAYPDVTNLEVQIITLFPGHAAEEVEKLVTIPLESEMNGIPKRLSMRSYSLFGLSVVTMVFADDASSDYVRNQAFQHLANVTLPPGAQASLSPDATAIGEICRVSLTAPPGFSPIDLKATMVWVVERQLKTVPGVVDVVEFGGPVKEYQVLVDPLRLRAYNLSLKQVFDALANGNRNAGGSYVEHGSELYIVRGLGFVQNTDDIGAIAVDTRGGVPIRIRDIGAVTIGEKVRLNRVGLAVKAGWELSRGPQRTGAPNGADPQGWTDNDDVPQGIVLMRRGENAHEALERVHEKVNEINAHYLPPGVKVILPYDRAPLLALTLHTVRRNMLEGITLVLGVLLLFLGLGNVRSALVVGSVVPLSLLGAFFLLDLRGIPANLISMGAIDFGIIVDSAVVIIENILRLLEERKRRPAPAAGDLVQVDPCSVGLAPAGPAPIAAIIVEAVSQMGRPILFAKAILLTAFIPLYSLQHVEGRIFRPMALTLTFAVIAGTLFALTVVPVLATFALRKKVGLEQSRIVRDLLRWYRPLLLGAIRARTKVLLGVAALLLGGVVCLALIGTEFLPKLEEGTLWVRVFMPETIAPSEAARLVKNMRGILISFPEVSDVWSDLGRPDDGTDINGFDVCEFGVGLRPQPEWTTAKTREELCEAMAKKLKAIPGIDPQFSQYIEDNVNEAVSGIKSELSLKIFGEDAGVLQKAADSLAEIIKSVPGAADVSAEHLLGQPQIQIAVDRNAIARYGLSVSDVQTVIETAMGGGVATQVLEGERTFDLTVKLTPHAVSDVDSIRNIPVFGTNGERLTLGSVTTVNVGSGFSKLYREENARGIAVKFGVRDRDLGSLVAEIKKRIDPEIARLPKGYRVAWAGSFENQQRATKRLLVVIPLTLIAMFFLLFSAFGSSGRLAGLILLCVPFSAVGGILALPVARLNLSVSSMVGFIALFGVAIQSGVLLVERIRQLRHEGKPMDEAVVEGAVSRVRPVVMTSMMAALGLLPAALSKGVGAETARPFAVVIIGGLVTATFLTLLILPILYPMFEKENPPAGQPLGTDA